MQDTLIKALTRHVVLHIENINKDISEAIAADTDNGAVGRLIDVQARLRIAQQLVDAAITLHSTK